MAATGKRNTQNVSVGKPLGTGGVFVAPVDATIPTNGTAELDTAFANLGYISEDGLTNTSEVDSEEIKAWGGDTVLTVQTSRSETFTFTLIESLNNDVLKQVYGQTNVSDGVVKHNGLERARQAFVFEILLTGNKVKRIVVPSGQITEVGDITYKDGEVIGYEVTLSAYPDDKGNTAYEYIAAIVGADS